MTDKPTLEEQLSALRPKALDWFSRLAIDGASHALADTTNPLRLNFFSTAMRILFEHMMGGLAPAEEIMQCPWFVLEKDREIPTRWQRVTFVIQGGLADAFVKDKLGVDVTPLRKRLLGAVDNLSKHVHARENTIIQDTAKQDAAAQATIEALADFLQTYHDCRWAILEPIQEELDDAAVDALISETIAEVDELATHHSLEEVHVDNTFIKTIGPRSISYVAEGSIAVVLQWGSNSDLRRGDGAELDQSFRFRCDIEVPLDDPWNLSLAETVYGVDTGDWNDAMLPDESDYA